MVLNQQHLELLKKGGATTLQGANLADADFTGADLSGANLNWARFTDAIITVEQLSSVKSRLEETF